MKTTTRNGWELRETGTDLGMPKGILTHIKSGRQFPAQSTWCFAPELSWNAAGIGFILIGEKWQLSERS